MRKTSIQGLDLNFEHPTIAATLLTESLFDCVPMGFIRETASGPEGEFQHDAPATMLHFRAEVNLKELLSLCLGYAECGKCFTLT